ncbi:hypothetical protein K2173_015182 [Erythroxylum novogranatense]|uniref:Uncharacterized protein n=1 Tax=Erythroxylum novogranatense TaxID=1862640 RepID=A0AAV8T2M6_9ROSI|nr:hypothetical protein K2173_015182 [Erythroxylum novogranatense]
MNVVCKEALKRMDLSRSRMRGGAAISVLLQSSSYATSSAKNPMPTTNPSSSSSLLSSSSSPWPRPKEIPFQAKVANSVNLIGYLNTPVQFQASSDGKDWAATVLTLDQPSSVSPHFRISITFEGDLAHIAACHLKQGDCVYISGQLTADPPPISVIQGQTHIQVLVHSFNFVLGSSRIDISCTPQLKEESTFKNYASTKKEGNSGLNSWMDLLHNSKEWWDYRFFKINGLLNSKHPDLKRKDGNLALWLDKAPSWILSELKKVVLDAPTLNLHKGKQQKGDAYWMDLVENPAKWWDNRVNKKNVRGPDFKHKETGKGLWLSDSPDWVLSRLPPLKQEQNDCVDRRDRTLS